jgi:hypothetical protein
MRLMIACPKIGDPVSVAADFDRERLVMLPSVNTMTRPCSLCGERHMWRMTDAWIENEQRLPMIDAA